MQYRHNKYCIDMTELIVKEESLLEKISKKEKDYLKKAKKLYKNIKPKEIEIVDIIYMGNDNYRIICNIIIE